MKIIEVKNIRPVTRDEQYIEQVSRELPELDRKTRLFAESYAKEVGELPPRDRLLRRLEASRGKL